MKQLYILLYILPVVVCTISSCEDNDGNNHQTNDVDTVNANFNVDIINDPCFYGINFYSYDEIIIYNNEDYATFEDSIKIETYGKECDTANLPPINFNKYTLLGKYTSGSGCSAYYERSIIKYPVDKTYIYTISVKYSGLCEMLIGSWNWALVPRIPYNYKITFKVNEK
jgi:hypothetical protein